MKIFRYKVRHIPCGLIETVQVRVQGELYETAEDEMRILEFAKECHTRSENFTSIQFASCPSRMSGIQAEVQPAYEIIKRRF